LIAVPQYDSIALAAFGVLAVALTYFGLRKTETV
jgi:hypothetical protein